MRRDSTVYDTICIPLRPVGRRALMGIISFSGGASTRANKKKTGDARRTLSDRTLERGALKYLSQIVQFALNGNDGFCYLL